MNTTTAIAQHLHIATEAIIKIEEWATVLWVRFKGGCRFVSKKINEVIQMTTELVGTEKQVVWANDIKAQMLDALNEVEQKTKDRLDRGKSVEKMTERLNAIHLAKQVINKIDSATAFIHGRYTMNPSAILQTVERIALWVNYKNSHGSDEWDAMYKSSSSHPMETIGANQGDSAWFLVRDAV